MDRQTAAGYDNTLPYSGRRGLNPIPCDYHAVVALIFIVVNFMILRYSLLPIFVCNLACVINTNSGIALSLIFYIAFTEHLKMTSKYGAEMVCIISL